LVFLGCEKGDDIRRSHWFARRLLTMKFFPDSEGRPWKESLLDGHGDVLVVSQFTLAARTRKGRRPSFDPAADPRSAEILYRSFIEEVRRGGATIAEGEFGAQMDVHLVNDGPVTFLLDGPESGNLP